MRNLKIHNLTEFGSKAGILLHAIALSFKAAPFETCLLVSMIALQGLVVPAGVWLSQLIITDLSSSVPRHQANVSLLVALWGANLLVGFLLDPWISLVTGNLNERLTAEVNLQMMRKANSLPDLEAFETPQFYDSLQILRREASHRPLNLVVTTIAMLRDAIAIGGLLVLLATLVWWLPLLVLIGTYPQARMSISLQSQSWGALMGGQLESRQMNYYQQTTTSDTNAKEVRMFGLGAFFEDRYHTAFDRFHTRMRQDRQRLALHPLPTTALALAGNIGAFGYVVWNALNQQLELGAVLLLIQALAQLAPRQSEFAMLFGLVGQHLLFFEKLFAFLNHASNMPTTGTISAPPQLQKGIVFCDVSFNYADGRRALQHVSFEVRPGEKVAIVGENGAGKSTLIKLLCRLYDPTSGVISVDGHDLRDYDVNDWRLSIGAVFQDFGQYHFTVKENISLGRVNQQGSIAEIEDVARLAGLNVAELPLGIDTLLGKQFGGTELSGGQWQKIAIARAFLRGAALLILDEPTAALDPRSEHELFNQFAELARDKTVLFVTHRLASVSMADRILVFKNGQLVESGTHTDLMKGEGEYASLYNMQAQKFVLEPA